MFENDVLSTSYCLTNVQQYYDTISYRHGANEIHHLPVLPFESVQCGGVHMVSSITLYAAVLQFTSNGEVFRAV